MLALIYVVMALGLNIVVGFAGLLDLGYVAFYAFGTYSVGWFASSHFAKEGQTKGIHFLDDATVQVGIHFNFLIVAVIAVTICAIAGILIGLPTLRLRGDYIAIVTLAFGEIIRVIAVQGDDINWNGYNLTNGKQGINPLDLPNLPGYGRLPDASLNLRPWYWLALVMVLFVLYCNFRLRDSRMGRAWIALREDEVAAVSMGIPLVRTKLLAYAAGAGFGGMAGALYAAYTTQVNADQFEFSFSILILAMVILGGIGSIWGVVVGAVVLTMINTYIINDVGRTFTQNVFNFDLSQFSFGVFGFLLVAMMVLRPEGLLPERRRKLEFSRHRPPRRVGLRGIVDMTAPSTSPAAAQPAAADNLLIAENITKAFGGLIAVNDVSFSIPRGSIVSIIGPNGAGKTTFFNMLSGLYKPTRGRIIFEDEDITRRRPDQITERGIARTFQNIRLFGVMTAVENVMAGYHARMKAGLVRAIVNSPTTPARGVEDPPARARDARVRRPQLAQLRRDREEPVVRRPAPRRDRPRADLGAEAAAARRADRRHEPERVGAADRLHAAPARRARADDPADRARHEGRHGRVRPHDRARPRREDRRGRPAGRAP